MSNFFDFLQQLYGKNEITPSIYRAELEMSFMDRYNRCLESNRESKNFLIKPSVLVFQNYQNISNLTLPFTILNTSRRQRPLNMEKQKSNTLKLVTTDYDLSTLILSESSITYKVQLNTNSLPVNSNRDKYEEIVFNSINDRFQLPVLIVGRKTLIEFPDRIEFDQLLAVGEQQSKSISIRNISSKSAKISIQLVGNRKNTIIKFEPKQLQLGANETEQFQIDCQLKKEFLLDNGNYGDCGNDRMHQPQQQQQFEIDAILEIAKEAKLRFKIVFAIKPPKLLSIISMVRTDNGTSDGRKTGSGSKIGRPSKKILKKKPHEMVVYRPSPSPSPSPSPPPIITLNVSRLDFGTVFMTKDSKKTVRVTNDGTRAISLTWSLCTDEVRVEPQSISLLSKNGVCDFTVVFAPKSVQKTDVVLECMASEINSDQSQTTVCKLTVYGYGLGPQLQLIQNRFVFCDLLAGLMKVIEVKIKNCGSIGGTVEFCRQLQQQKSQLNCVPANDSEFLSDTKYCTAIDSSTFPAMQSQLYLTSSSLLPSSSSSSSPLFHTVKCYPQKLDLKPDETSHIKLAFSIRKYGAFFEQLTFRVNETNQLLNVIVEGNIIEPNLLEHLPHVIDFERIAYGFAIRRELQITNSSEVEIPFTAELLCGSGSSTSTASNQQRAQLWSQFLAANCRSRLSLPGDTAAVVNEMQFEPLAASISPYSALTALLTVTSNTVGVTKTGFILKTGTTCRSC